MGKVDDKVKDNINKLENKEEKKKGGENEDAGKYRRGNNQD